MKRKEPRYLDDLKERLKDPTYAAGYLNAVLDDAEEGSDAILLLALRDLADARQMSRVAQKAGVNRENLYRMLSGKGNPRLNSFVSVLKAVGLRLSIQPAGPSAPTAAEVVKVVRETSERESQQIYSESETYRKWVDTTMLPATEYEDAVCYDPPNGLAYSA